MLYTISLEEDMNIYESFLVNMYFWLLLALGIGVSLIALRFLGHILLGAPIHYSKKVDHTFSEKRQESSYRASKSGFSEKVGEKVVKYLIDVTRSMDPNLLRSRIEAIRKECMLLNKKSLPPENKKIISSVLYWSRKFDIERHVFEMKTYQTSSQISYDPRKKDFQLKVIN